MKIVMFNDCANVGETLLKCLPPEIEKQHILRTRDPWSKTFGIAYKISTAKADVYHSNYLLQDCYIAARLGKKPLVGYGLGTDLRNSLNRSLLGRIVRHNLKACNKVLTSTPDILAVARQYREDVEYLPPPVNSELFYVKPPEQHDEKKRVLIASNSNWNVKGTDIAIRALSKYKEEIDLSIIEYGIDFKKTLSLAHSLDMNPKVLPLAPHNEIREHYWNADVVVDQFKFGCAGMISLEAIACGRPAITYVTSKYPEYSDYPLKDLATEDQISEAVINADDRLWEKEYEYLKRNHKLDVATQRLLKIYMSLTEL